MRGPGELDVMSARTLAHYDRHAEASARARAITTSSQNIAALLRHIEAEPPFTILDLGCGPGRDLADVHAARPRAIGLDGAASFGAMARSATGCEVWQQDFLAARSARRHFDGVFANAALFHVPSRRNCRAFSASCTRRSSRAVSCSAPTRAARTRKAGTEGATARTTISRRGAATCRAPASSSSSTTTGRRDCRASSSRGWRACGGQRSDDVDLRCASVTSTGSCRPRSQGIEFCSRSTATRQRRQSSVAAGRAGKQIHRSGGLCQAS